MAKANAFFLHLKEMFGSVSFNVKFCLLDAVHCVSMSNLSSLLLEATLKESSIMGDNVEPIEGILNSLILRLLRRICNASSGDGKSLLYLLL